MIFRDRNVCAGFFSSPVNGGGRKPVKLKARNLTALVPEVLRLFWGDFSGFAGRIPIGLG